jgi:hypothetical protein
MIELEIRELAREGPPENSRPSSIGIEKERHRLLSGRPGCGALRPARPATEGWTGGEPSSEAFNVHWGSPCLLLPDIDRPQPGAFPAESSCTGGETFRIPPAKQAKPAGLPRYAAAKEGLCGTQQKAGGDSRGL